MKPDKYQKFLKWEEKEREEKRKKQEGEIDFERTYFATLLAN